MAFRVNLPVAEAAQSILRLQIVAWRFFWGSFVTKALTNQVAVPFVDNVVPKFAAWRSEGLRAALVTLVNVEGSAPRPAGSQMAVNERGEAVGNITSGCAEAELIGQALRCIETGQKRVERYGRGSKYLDIRLPCGSGIDVSFDPNISDEIIGTLLKHQNERRPIGLRFELAVGDAEVVDLSNALTKDPWHLPCRLQDDTTFVRPYLPQLRVVIAGRGPAVNALAQIVRALDWQIRVATPERDFDPNLRLAAHEIKQIASPGQFDASGLDRWSAAVLLFHDHDWEPTILQRILATDCFYVGALGSRITHEARCEALETLGVAQQDIARIRAPIGLDIGALSPPEIALSIAGEILAASRTSRLVGHVG